MADANQTSAVATRNVVVCCDGTGNEFSTNRSNVLRLWRSLDRSANQVAYYDPGVGTLVDSRALTRWRKLLFKRLDGAIGLSVRDNVLEAYAFLVENWREGDRVFLFGFSRGAYTVRALAGMLQWFGLVRPEHANVLPYLWSLYSDEGGEIGDFGTRKKAAGGIRNSMGRVLRVHFLGAWDTVSSFGWIWRPRTLPETAKAGIVDHIRHAVSIDERRRGFAPNLFTPEKPENCVQMLFPGVHSDVGGGYPAEESGLAKGALQWMLEEAGNHDLRYAEPARSVEVNGKNGREKPDPDGPMHDELRRFAWRIVEMLPGRPAGWILTPIVAIIFLVLAWMAVLPWLAVATGLVVVVAGRAPWCWRGRPRRFDRPIAKGVPAPVLVVHPSVRQRQGYRPGNLPPGVG